MLGGSVGAYLDDGFSRTGVASTIIDATALVNGTDEGRVRILREGAISRADLQEVLGDLLEPEQERELAEPESQPEPAVDAEGPS